MKYERDRYVKTLMQKYNKRELNSVVTYKKFKLKI
jgi:hypothetical protein